MSCSPGVAPGSTLLTTIVAVDPIQFVFDASESDHLRYSRLSARGERRSSRDAPNPVRIRLLDEPTFSHQGTMDFVNNQLDPATGTIRGRAIVPNPGGSARSRCCRLDLQGARRRMVGGRTPNAQLADDDGARATNTSGDELGPHGLMDIARELDLTSAASMAQGLAAELRRFRGGETPSDDESIVIVRRLPVGAVEDPCGGGPCARSNGCVGKLLIRQDFYC